MIAFARTLLYLVILTSSFDLVGVLHVGGANARFSSLLMLSAFGFTLVIAAVERKLQRPIGFTYLLAWTALNLFFLTNTPYFFRSTGYLAWLLIDVALIIAMCTLFRSESSVFRMAMWSWYSYVILSLFGILQFVIATLHLSEFFVRERFASVFPRLNGLSYEPSYYATYIIAGWFVSGYLLLKQVYLIRRPALIAVFQDATRAAHN